MDSDSWSTRISAASKRYQSRSDLYLGGMEENDGDDDSRTEYLCPFCAEDFDIVGLCCHIDEDHPVEAKNGRKRRFRKGGSNSFSILRKELREGNLQSLFGGSSCKVSSSDTEPDPLLSSFINNLRLADEPMKLQSHPSVEPSSVKQSLDDSLSERNAQQPLLSDKDQEEKARKCEFVRGLLLSTILDDGV